MNPSAQAVEEMGEETGMPLVDKLDLAIFLIAWTGGVFGLGYSTHEWQAKDRMQVCPRETADGRRLTAQHLGPRGAERCVFEAPKPHRWKSM